MSNHFYHDVPIMQYWLIEKNIKEYHIRLRKNKYYSNLYYENKKKDIWIDIRKFILEKYKLDIISHGSDYCENNNTYIWIQVKRDSDIIDKIINSLNDEWFTNNLQNTNMIPKLMTILYKTLNSDNKYMANCICEYQEKHGKIQTLMTLDVYFSDIKKQCNRMYYRYDSDDDSKESL